MAERCDFTDLDSSMCSHCRPTRATLESADAASRLAPTYTTSGPTPAGRPWFTAVRAGRCAVCGEPFAAGAQIRLQTPAGWRADCCRNTSPGIGLHSPQARGLSRSRHDR